MKSEDAPDESEWVDMVFDLLRAFRVMRRVAIDQNFEMGPFIEATRRKYVAKDVDALFEERMRMAKEAVK